MIESVENPFRPGERITLDSRLHDVMPSLVSLKIRRAVGRLLRSLGEDYCEPYTVRQMLLFDDQKISLQPQVGATSMVCVRKLREAFAAAESAPPSTIEDRIATLEANVAKILAAFASLTPPPR